MINKKSSIKFKLILLLVSMVLGIFVLTLKPSVDLTYAATSTNKSYILISNKITELDHKSTHTFLIKTVGLSNTKISWSSSNLTVATISNTGKLVPKSSGYVTITAKDRNSGKKSSCKLFVRPEPTKTSYFTYKVVNKKAIITGFQPKETVINLVIPGKLGGYPVTEIGDSVFFDKTSIRSISFPSSITKIGNYTFYGCSALKEVKLPSKLTSLGEGAFASCTSLTSCIFPTKMTSISHYAFNNCTSLVKVTLPTSLKTVGDAIFSASGVEYLTNLSIAASMDTDYFLNDTEKQVLKKMKQVLKEIIDKSDSDVEKVKKVHDWIILNATYDLRIKITNDIPASSFSAEGIMLYQTAVCAGYAEAFSMFMELLNIESKYIVGTGNGVNHAWNSVKLDGKWYQIDVTWDDPTPDQGGISYNYFLITDRMMGRDHIWDTSKYPAATSTAYRYYAYKDDICETEASVRKRIERGIKEKEEWITILTPASLSLKNIIFEYANSYSYRTPYQLGDYVVNVISLIR